MALRTKISKKQTFLAFCPHQDPPHEWRTEPRVIKCKHIQNIIAGPDDTKINIKLNSKLYTCVWGPRKNTHLSLTPLHSEKVCFL